MSDETKVYPMGDTIQSGWIGRMDDMVKTLTHPNLAPRNIEENLKKISHDLVQRGVIIFDKETLTYKINEGMIK